MMGKAAFGNQHPAMQDEEKIWDPADPGQQIGYKEVDRNKGEDKK